MKPIYAGILNLLGFGLVLTMNALANILPINGYNTGQVSAFYPNYFVPAGFTFGIWGIIYLLLMGYVICSLLSPLPSFPENARRLVVKTSPYFLVTCILNASWIVAWHYLYLGLSLFIMLAFLVTLIALFLAINKSKSELRPFYRFWIYHPFVVYLGWISVATIANVTALFVGIGWQGEPFAATTWSAVLITIALLLGVILVGVKKEPAYGFVLAWAFFGIYSSQLKDATMVGYTAAVYSSFILALKMTFLFFF
jgi:benzodiazapine receptor